MLRIRHARSPLWSLVGRLPAKFRKQYEGDTRLVEKRGAETIDDVSKLLRRKNVTREVRASCCWLLGLARHKPSVQLLISAYRSSDKKLIWEAGKALAKIGGARVAKTFARQLRRRNDEERRIVAAWGSGALGTRNAVSPLVKVLGDKRESPRLRSEAAEALGYVSDRRAVPHLIRATFDDSVQVRFWAAFALGQIADPRALPRLRRLASSDHSSLSGWHTVSKEAAFAIRQLRLRRGIGTMQRAT